MKSKSLNTLSGSYESQLLFIVLIEYLLFIISGVSFSSLHQIPYFNIGVDPAYWIAYILNIPQFIVAHHWLGIFIDSSIVLLLFGLIIYPSKNILAFAIFILLLIFYLTLTGYLGHHNFQSGFVFILIPYLFKEKKNRSFAFEAIRYFLLFFYFSAAVYKLTSVGLYNQDHFSNILSGQFAPYFIEGNIGWRTSFNNFLINHNSIAYSLYIGAFIFEFSVVVGFFTKRFDIHIGIIVLCFHLFNWIIMDISVIGQIAFIALLFYKKNPINQIVTQSQ